jgi:hypothetical protein
MVGAVKVLAIPAGGEVMYSHDTTRARREREIGQLGESSVGNLEADVA